MKDLFVLLNMRFNIVSLVVFINFLTPLKVGFSMNILKNDYYTSDEAEESLLDFQEYEDDLENEKHQGDDV